jgi:RNA polymerase sigma factor (TIGR02999 family)
MDTQDFAELLAAYSRGDRGAFDQIVTLVYDELRRLASYYLRNEGPGHTLQTTALVHEAYARLAKSACVPCKDRAHFMALAAQTMRRILVDHARRRNYRKRGGGAEHVSLDQAPTLSIGQLPGLVTLDEALCDLERVHPHEAKIFEMSFFAEMQGKEIAEALGVSPAKVSVDLKFAKAWLKCELSRYSGGGDGERARAEN